MPGVKESLVKMCSVGGRLYVSACTEDKTDMKLQILCVESILFVVQQ